MSQHRTGDEADCDVLRLVLSEGVRSTLSTLLAAALILPDSGNVEEWVPDHPWGDLAAFQREVYFPLHGQRSASAKPTGYLSHVVIAAGDVEPIRAVIDGLAESISGGVPWRALTETERAAVERSLTELGVRFES